MEDASCLPESFRGPEGLEQYVTELAAFLRSTRWLWASHVVDFFTSRLWEHFPEAWLPTLKELSLDQLCLVPSGHFQEAWPETLQEYIHRARRLSLARAPHRSLQSMEKPTALPQIMAQGMSPKKRHEVAVLAALVAEVAASSKADVVLDVGAGQGYLSQVLAFHYKLPVVAIDACPGHAEVTTARSTAIAKYCANRSSANESLPLGSRGPITLTERIELSRASYALADLLASVKRHTSDRCREQPLTGRGEDRPSQQPAGDQQSGCVKVPNHGFEGHEMQRNEVGEEGPPRVLLAGLHACGDLSASMLRAFTEWKEVVAVVNVSCCYNLLSEESTCGSCCSDTTCLSHRRSSEPPAVLPARDGCSETSHNNSRGDESFGEPAEEGGEKGSNSWGFPLSKAVRKEGLELGRHGRMLACQSAERWEECSPTAAGQLFRQHAFRAALQTVLERHYPAEYAAKPAIGRQMRAWNRKKRRGAAAANDQSMATDEDDFVEYATLALQQLDLPTRVNRSQLQGLWQELSPFMGLVGPYWALRAALAGPLEALMLVDRLLFMRECQENLSRPKLPSQWQRVSLLPLFEPSVSPRNMAILAIRNEVS